MTGVGLVGGLGPESTIDYYRRILEVWNEARPGTSPSILIDSLDVQLGIRLINEDLPALTDYLLDSIRRLAAGGVEFVALAANSPHIVFDDLAAWSPVSLLSIVDVCAAEARRLGLRRSGLLGTRFTMEGGFYPGAFERLGMTVIAPDPEDRARIHDRYIGQLLKGDFREETRQEVLAVVRGLQSRQAIDGVILAGTELPLLLRGADLAGLPVLDTTELHVAAIVARLLEST